MSRILKLLTTLCGQVAVLTLMALATSALATDAEASGWAPQDKAKVKFNSSTAERFRTEVTLDGPPRTINTVKFTYESKSGHDSNAYCNHRAWIVDWRVIDGGHNVPIEIPRNLAKNKKFALPITLCRRGIEKTFRVVWTADSGPFNKDADNCWSSTSCWTEVTIKGVNADITAPRVSSITRQSPSTSPTNADSLTWRVTFNEAVQNVDAADFQVSGTTATLSVSKILNTDYDVTASGGDLAGLNGTVTLGFDSSHNVQDTSGNKLTNLTRTGANDNTFVVENTAAQPAITIAGGSAVTEGTDATFTLTASPAPTADLTVNLTVSESNDFVAGNDEGTDTVTIGISGTATYTVPTVNDTTDEANGSVKVTVNEGSGYTVGDPESAKVTVNDNDTRGLVLNPTSLTVNEGSSADYTVKLATKPTAEVTVTVGGAGSGITVDTDTSTAGDQSTLTFTTSNWNQTQTVRVSAGQDANTANESVTLTHTTAGGDYGTNLVSKNLVITADDTTTPATPTLSLSGPASANEGNSGTRDLTYTVSLTSAISSDFVAWKVCLDGTATRDTDGGAIHGNADYQPRSGNSAYVGTDCFSQAFNTSSPALSNTDLMIRVKGDTVVEQDETVIATLTITDNTAGVALGTATHTHTIRDDDGGTVADTTAPRVISITRQTPSSSPTDADSLTWRVTFDEAVQNVDAADFKLTGTTASLSVLEISNSVFDVTASGGDLAGLNGEVRLGFDSSHSIEDTSGNRLSNLTRTGSNDNTFEVRNTATTPFLVLSKNTLNVAEGGTGNYTVNLATEPTGTVTVAIASNNTDVTASPTSLTFHASSGSKPWNTAQTVTVSAGQDGDDADESATLTHTAAGGGYGSVTGSVTVTVNDDDSPPPTQPAASFASASSSTAEDAGTHSVTVSLSTAAPAGGLTLGYSVSGTATAGSGNDFTIQNSGTLSVSAGVTTTTIPVAINDDSTNENDKTVILTLTGGTGYTLGNPKAHTLTITDNDETASPLSSPSQPVITISGGNAVTEGTAASFTLTASPASGTSLVVNLNVSEETGGGQDYVAASDEGGKTVTISANAGTATFTVGTIADSTDEPNGRVMVAVNSGIGYSRGSTSSASVAVNDDDATPSSSLSSPSQPVITIAGGSPVTEGTAPSFTLTASPAPSANLDVNVNVTQNGDFVASNDRGTKTVTIPAGQTSKTFTIPTQSDSTDEPNGSVTSTLATGTGYSVGSTSSASVAVNDDDATPSSSTSSFGDDRSLSIDDAAAMEKDGVISFTVRLSAATVGNSQATVRVATRDVTAVSGLDYRSVDTRLVFRAGETTKVVTVGLINDAHNEGAETFEVVLSNPSNAIIGDGVATGTINNADYVPRSELAHFGRSVANQVLEGVIGRIRSPRAPGVSARIAGNAVPSGRAPGPNCTVCNTLSTDKRVEKFDREEVLTNSSFVLNGQDAPGRSPAFWGRGTRSDFTDRPGGLSLDGGVTSFMLGTDLGWNDGRLLGLALIRSSGEIDHMEWAGGGDRNTGRTELTLTALVPYAGWKINERVDAWGALGHGSGEMHLGLNAGERAEEISAGFDWTMAAGGLRGALAGFDDGPRLTAVLDGWRVKTSSKETEGLAATRSSMTRLRAGLEAGWEMQLEDGAVLAPRLETNLIRESGDTGSSFGLELVGGLSWTDPGLGLAIDMSARRLRSDESSGRKDHGYSMALVYDPDPDSGRGLSLSMRQETGNPGSTMDDFLTSSLPGGADEGGTHWTTELAYGLPAVGGSFTGSPHAGIEETDDYRDYKLGWRLTPAGPQAPDISFDINASRREQTMSSSADHRLGIGLVAEW